MSNHMTGESVVFSRVVASSPKSASAKKYIERVANVVGHIACTTEQEETVLPPLVEIAQMEVLTSLAQKQEELFLGPQSSEGSQVAANCYHGYIGPGLCYDCFIAGEVFPPYVGETVFPSYRTMWDEMERYTDIEESWAEDIARRRSQVVVEPYIPVLAWEFDDE